MAHKYEKDAEYRRSQGLHGETTTEISAAPYDLARDDDDVFGSEEGHQIKYKTLTWPFVAFVMITEIVSNGIYSLPQSLAIVGIVPGVILIVFLGIFALFTSWLLIQFKLRHPKVHNMGDAGYIIAGPIGREVLGFGTVLFAICGSGSQMLSGYYALSSLSDNKLCAMLYTGIFALPILLCSFFRTLDHLSWLSIPGCACILLSALVGMIGAGTNPVADRTVSVAISSSFVDAFASITNPVFAYAGHFLFFMLISEMKNPRDAMKAAWTLQGFATTFYAVYAIVMYVYIGNDVASPVNNSLPIKWAKASWAIAIPNFFIAGSIYSHAAAKLWFIRLFRQSEHLHEHTIMGWGIWALLVLIVNAAAFVLAVGVPIFPYFVGITAAIFASWYTYGIAGAFWLHDAYHDHGGIRGWVRKPVMAALSSSTFLAGAFICVAGTTVFIKLIIAAYKNGEIAGAFIC